MKPLQVFEKHPDVDAYRFGPSFTPYSIVAVDKRFTDAELMAEYWAANFAAAIMKDWRDESDKAQMIERFATLPHYDE